MYPSGVGTSYTDPRRSNHTKSQSLQFQRGINVLKDMSESTANGQSQPADSVGSNLRRGRGLSFQNGIAQFDRFQGQKPGLSQQAEAAKEVKLSSSRPLPPFLSSLPPGSLKDEE